MKYRGGIVSVTLSVSLSKERAHPLGGAVLYVVRTFLTLAAVAGGEAAIEPSYGNYLL